MADHINGSLDDHERGAFLCGSQDEKHGKVGEALSCQRGIL
jgi:hypothetical protein